MTDGTSWPCGLSKETKEQLESISIHKEDSQLSFLRSYQPFDGLYCISRGIISFGYETENNRGLTSVSATFGQGDWFGASSIANPMQTFIQAELVEPCKFHFFHRNQLLQLLKKNDEIYKLLYFITRESHVTVAQCHIISLAEMIPKVSYVLLDLLTKVRRYSPKSSHVQVSQVQLSRIAGVSRPKLNQILKQMEKDNTISVHYGSIEIVKPEALAVKLQDVDLSYKNPIPHLF